MGSGKLYAASHCLFIQHLGREDWYYTGIAVTDEVDRPGRSAGVASSARHQTLPFRSRRVGIQAVSQ